MQIKFAIGMRHRDKNSNSARNYFAPPVHGNDEHFKFNLRSGQLLCVVGFWGACEFILPQSPGRAERKSPSREIWCARRELFHFCPANACIIKRRPSRCLSLHVSPWFMAHKYLHGEDCILKKLLFESMQSKNPHTFQHSAQMKRISPSIAL